MYRDRLADTVLSRTRMAAKAQEFHEEHNIGIGVLQPPPSARPIVLDDREDDVDDDADEATLTVQIADEVQRATLNETRSTSWSCILSDRRQFIHVPSRRMPAG